jgi:hypothetical protein
MRETEISEPQACSDCIFQDIFSSIRSCRFYPKYTGLPFTLGQNPLMKPTFCRIKKIVVYEEPLEGGLRRL